MNKLSCSQYFFVNTIFLIFWTNDVTNFPKVMKLISLLNCHLIFSILVLETLKFECQCNQYLELNPTCDMVFLQTCRFPPSMLNLPPFSGWLRFLMGCRFLQTVIIVWSFTATNLSTLQKIIENNFWKAFKIIPFNEGFKTWNSNFYA